MKVTCPKCLERAASFVLPISLASEIVIWTKDNREGFLLARETKAVLTEEWRQSTDHKLPSIWKKGHDIVVDTTKDYECIRHITLRNRDHSRAQPVLFCHAPKCLHLEGPGASTHIAADAEFVASRKAEEHFESFHKARKEATNLEMDSYCLQLKDGFDALGFDVSTGGGFMEKHATSIQINLDDAAKILNALGATAAQRPVDPMPVFCVRYGDSPDDDKEPLLLGARNKTDVVAHTMERFCSKLHKNGSYDPLNPEKLHIELVDEPTEPPEETDD